MHRRFFLISGSKFLVGASTILTAPRIAFAQSEKTPPEAEGSGSERTEFSFEALSAMMKERASEDFAQSSDELPEAIAELNYDQHRAIRFRPEEAFWHGEAPFELQAFHPGWLFKHPVRLNVVENGRSSPIHIESDKFEYRKPLDPSDFAGLELPGVAGFRLHYPLNDPRVMDELVVFLGASYFRSLGQGNVYGISARGIAVNTATSQGEEFPSFTEFWIEKPTRQSKTLTIYAALEGPSLTGAYRFVMTPEQNTTMDVTARLYLRRDVLRLGIAPMTSMFLFAGNNDHAFDDYREQVHDSDGLKVVRADGSEIWRSLNNPSELAMSFFGETDPKAFGLFQRDRVFAHYQDAGASYERRPSLLVEPKGQWGKGFINLVEIPTELEINDNIVAFWVPEGKAERGQEYEFEYRLTWGAVAETSRELARVIDFRTGIGGVSGVENPEDLRKFVIDFEGDVLSDLDPEEEGLEANVWVSNAKIAHQTVSRVKATGAWRLVFDLVVENDNPVEMSASLKKGDQQVSETWVYQWRRNDGRSQA